jgi:hypothetical protein
LLKWLLRYTLIIAEYQNIATVLLPTVMSTHGAHYVPFMHLVGSHEWGQVFEVEVEAVEVVKRWLRRSR